MIRPRRRCSTSQNPSQSLSGSPRLFFHSAKGSINLLRNNLGQLAADKFKQSPLANTLLFFFFFCLSTVSPPKIEVTARLPRRLSSGRGLYTLPNPPPRRGLPAEEEEEEEFIPSEEHLQQRRWFLWFHDGSGVAAPGVSTVGVGILRCSRGVASVPAQEEETRTGFLFADAHLCHSESEASCEERANPAAQSALNAPV